MLGDADRANTAEAGALAAYYHAMHKAAGEGDPLDGFVFPDPLEFLSGPPATPAGAAGPRAPA